MNTLRIPILYEDNHLLVAVKPAGMLSQQDLTGAKDILTLLKHDLAIRGHKRGEAYLGLVHRLDRPVSGVMIFAKTSKAASRLSDQIRRHAVKKYYLALVDGLADFNDQRCEDYLTSKPIGGKIRVTDSTKGRQAVLTASTLRRDKVTNTSLLFISLATGRRHQIRVQLAARGYPVVGDRRYGLAECASSFPAPGLHAAWLMITHPTKQTDMIFYADPCANAAITSMAGGLTEADKTWLSKRSELGPSKKWIGQPIRMIDS